MKRIKLIVSYDGTEYCGWQLQPAGLSIEAVLNEKLSALLKEEIQVIGASRTDSGVHALGNVAVFDTETRIPPDKICMALNQHLPPDIVIQSSCEVPLPWHPRKCNSRKTYEYRILNRKIPLPCRRRYAYFYYVPLDVEAMKKAAECLVGEHDFASFCSSRSQAEDTVREIYSLTVEKEGEEVVIRVSGNGFLYNMVRIIAGTLLRVGTGFYPPEHMREILEARDRATAGPKVPGEGLTLVSIEEETDLEPVVKRETKDWSYQMVQKEIRPKGEAYLLLDRCEERDYERMVLRLTKQCVRNGARWVHLRDATERIFDGREFDYFTYLYEGKMWEMACDLDKFRKGEEAEALRLTAGRGILSRTALTESLGETYLRVCREAFRDAPMSASWDSEDFRRLLSEEHREAWLLEAEGKPVGFAEWSWEKDFAELAAVGILPEFRGRGYGRMLAAQFLEEAADRGCAEARLICADFNERAWKLYCSFGFEKETLLSVWYKTQDQHRNLSEKTEKND